MNGLPTLDESKPTHTRSQLQASRACGLSLVNRQPYHIRNSNVSASLCASATRSGDPDDLPTRRSEGFTGARSVDAVNRWITCVPQLLFTLLHCTGVAFRCLAQPGLEEPSRNLLAPGPSTAHCSSVCGFDCLHMHGA